MTDKSNKKLCVWCSKSARYCDNTGYYCGSCIVLLLLWRDRKHTKISKAMGLPDIHEQIRHIRNLPDSVLL